MKEHSSTSNTQSLSAPADATRPKTVGLWPAMKRSPVAEHLAAPPVARQQLRTARNALNVCSTVPASDYAGIATIAPPPEPREATCECVETRKRRLNGRTLAEACVRLSSLSHSSVRQSARFAFLTGPTVSRHIRAGHISAERQPVISAAAVCPRSFVSSIARALHICSRLDNISQTTTRSGIMST